MEQLTLLIPTECDLERFINLYSSYWLAHPFAWCCHTVREAVRLLDDEKDELLEMSDPF